MIEVSQLTRKFSTKQGTVEAVRGVDFEVAEGETVGFLGANGAGKTTTLRMLTTLLGPSSGTATVAGHDLRSEPIEVRKRIGYVAQAGGTDPRTSVREELALQARLYRVPASEVPERVRRVSHQLDLHDLLDREAGALSGGQRRRLDIALGLIHRPPLVFLDEPTSGLDPQARSALWEHIRRLREELGTTIFLTTHYLEEADALCDRLLIIDQGRIVTEGKPEELKSRAAGDLITIELPSGELVDRAKALLGSRDDVRELAAAGSTLRLTVERGEQAVLDMLRVLDGAELRPTAINLARPSLDQVFLAFTGRSLSDDPGATT
ncbi:MULTISPECIES: ATP-binding cassette domain-containing protein [unclassified Actinopolyspora]|uniref:ABC transporter ATP-binding protein n=1 Tax=unclassified Actinopolyspora TaxID=2639451 RepID=UPI0013F5989C|nr:MULTISPECIES: ATP-binding cassette domain-containing protein [unclassified Actinopolyspora]NHD16230.1 ATP-binding cassette domain-containing protein [Actinopolyspora sp. BKK2]NHE75907.1 ATP-binding cassette domain-containing protein [Actinopolyspora sp. BKK1]